MKELSPRQLIFIRAYCAGKTGAAAARAAGYGKDPKKAAERLLDNPLVKAEVERAKDKIREATLYDAKAAMAEFDEAIAFARQTENASAMVRAVEMKSKLNGLLIEKIDQRVQSGFQINIVGIDAPALSGADAKLIEGESGVANG